MRLCMHSYTFRAYPLDRALKKAAQYGWDGIELNGKHFDADDLKTSLDEIIEAAAKYGVDISVIDFPGNFIQDDRDEAKRSVERMAEWISLVRNYGIQIMNGGVGSLAGDNPGDYGRNGSALATEEHYERAAEALRQLGAQAQSEGVVLTLEIHMNTLHDTAASTRKLLDMVGSPAVLANPDPGNMYATSTAEDGVQAIEMLEGKIGLAHLKNCINVNGTYSYSTLLESGDIDFFNVLAALQKTGYDGPVTVEYCGLGDPNVAAARDVTYVRSILNELSE
ncbi:MAG: sugar phosphate isomerase/epimerase [Planctomycetes bacterium]|nr:sugar phosphate isomerase/epimerase [Planctomycetota bacterium]